MICVRTLVRRVVPWILFGLFVLAGASAADETTEEQRRLWNEVDREVALLGGSLGFQRLSPRVRDALASVPRHVFVPESQRQHAYLNRPLPIGYGQTISQPFIVAIMTELLQIKPGDRVFELGTGSGYQAAVLTALDAEVYSMEIVPELGTQARENLRTVGATLPNLRIGDGYLGWEAAGPFDAIIVTAAGNHIPPPLIQQLKPGGRMVLPVGGRYQTQQLVVVTRDLDGTISTRELLPVVFVPLTGGH